MNYRSDWPEVGLLTALNERSFGGCNTHYNDDQAWIQEIKTSGAIFRWIATQNVFESNLYKFPIWSLRLEVDDTDSNVLTTQLDSTVLQEFFDEGICQLFDVSSEGAVYVFSKVVKDEPLYKALHQIGFQDVEFRRLYQCKVQDLASHAVPFPEDNIRFTSLEAISPKQLSSYHEQIFDICREAFEKKGYSRHFTDPVLLERQPGIAYILAMMKLNFEHMDPNHFLIAIDINSNQICGFSVVGRKFGFERDRYSQLLSAVRKVYRKRGIYRGLTYLLSQTLPQAAVLLNVTHTDNYAIQRAYQNSGRVHLADTVVLRKFFNTSK